jgi:RsiW-degrading membrane proteinase PrsW (M82 family)
MTQPPPVPHPSAPQAPAGSQPAAWPAPAAPPASPWPARPASPWPDRPASTRPATTGWAAAGASAGTWPAPAAPAGAWPAPVPAAGPAAPPPKPPRRMDWWRLLWLSVVVVVIAGSGIAMLAYVGYNIGPVALGVGIAAAVLPVPLLVLCFLWLDRYEPEPLRYLVFCFAWGACVATGVALLVNMGGEDLFRYLGLPDAFVAFLVAPFIEESMKAAGPVLLFLVRRRSFSGVVDGIVYCGLSATGFAMVENILYLGGYGYAANADRGGVAAGVAGVVALFIGRIVIFGFGHPLFTSMTGIGLGVAARTPVRLVRWLAPLTGLLVAMMLHGSWNFMVVLAQQSGRPEVLLYGYFSVMVPIFFALVGFAMWLRGREARLTQLMLPAYARAGWLSPPEVASLATVGRRLAARRWARRVSGEAGVAAMRGYQFAATQLSLLRDGVLRGLRDAPRERERAAVEERELLSAITGYRAVYVGRDPVAPPAWWNGTAYRLMFPDGQVREVAEPPAPVVPVPVLLVPAAPAPFPGAPGGWPGQPGTPHHPAAG